MINDGGAFSKRKGADALIIPFFEGKKPAFEDKSVLAMCKMVLDSGDFQGKKEEVLCHYVSGAKEARFVLVGLGKKEEVNAETLRRAYAKAIQALKEKVLSVNVQLPTLDKGVDVPSAVTEGVCLANYIFDENKTKKDKKIDKIAFFGGISKVAEEICKGVYLTRDLVMQSADVVTPTFLGKKAQELGKLFPKLKVTVLGKTEIKKLKMGLLEAVSRGSNVDPALILIEYRGAPKSQETIAFVGKGVTFDTGGLNLKPTGGIENMRDDMSGAAAVLGTLRNVAVLELPLNVVGVIGSTENAIGPDSFKPGDVYTGYDGTKVEISNTDAEGRLVLADALSYVQQKHAPTQIIDMATLTGGAIVALGEEVSAVMGNDDELSKRLIAAGEKTYERLWSLPLYEEYEALLKSKYADIKNSGPRKASSIQGGIFLKKFIKKAKWAHIDIAGTAFPDDLKPYHPIQATGVGVRLMTTFLQSLC